jgi:ribosome maturation factor RimP
LVVEHIRAAIESPLAGLGLLVEDVSVTPAGRRRVVRIAVDRDLAALDLEDATTPVEPLSLDEVTEATRAVDAALEAGNTMGDDAYLLEVSSVGVDRPLTEHRHLRRNVGRVVALRAVDGTELEGRITSVTGDEVRLDTADGPVGMPLAQVRSARVQVEFGRLADVEESA